MTVFPIMTHWPIHIISLFFLPINGFFTAFEMEAMGILPLLIPLSTLSSARTFSIHMHNLFASKDTSTQALKHPQSQICITNLHCCIFWPKIPKLKLLVRFLAFFFKNLPSIIHKPSLSLLHDCNTIFIHFQVQKQSITIGLLQTIPATLSSSQPLH